MSRPGHHPAIEPRRTTREPPRWTGPALGAGFIVLAVALVATSGRPVIPIVDTARIEPAVLEVGPRRIAMTDPAHTMVNGHSQSCAGCHQIFHSASPAGAALSYHGEIDLRHGLNDRCINCHDASDMSRLTLRDGTLIPFSQTPLLCAQCHGTAYRDWQRGMHGKTLGSWITGSAEQVRLTCNECHNPHAPRYEPYTPLPGPATLRMGDPHAHDHHGTHGVGPLQQWIHDHAPAHRPGSEGHR